MSKNMLLQLWESCTVEKFKKVLAEGVPGYNANFGAIITQNILARQSNSPPILGPFQCTALGWEAAGCTVWGGGRLLVGIMHCAAATISCCQPRPAAAAAEDLPRTLLISVHANLIQTLCF